MLDEFFQLTLAATVQRANVYAPGVSEICRKKFQNSLRKKLFDLWPKYRAAAWYNAHNRNIERLANQLSKQHRHLLNAGRFRIGPAQKALNLFLKYLWCAGLLEFPPPHCPFDRKIIGDLGLSINWTTLDDMAKYRQLVRAARKCARANGAELAQWELERYNRP